MGQQCNHSYVLSREEFRPMFALVTKYRTMAGHMNVATGTGWKQILGEIVMRRIGRPRWKKKCLIYKFVDEVRLCTLYRVHIINIAIMSLPKYYKFKGTDYFMSINISKGWRSSDKKYTRTLTTIWLLLWIKSTLNITSVRNVKNFLPNNFVSNITPNFCSRYMSMTIKQRLFYIGTI